MFFSAALQQFHLRESGKQKTQAPQNNVGPVFLLREPSACRCRKSNRDTDKRRFSAPIRGRRARLVGGRPDRSCPFPLPCPAFAAGEGGRSVLRPLRAGEPSGGQQSRKAPAPSRPAELNSSGQSSARSSCRPHPDRHRLCRFHLSARRACIDPYRSRGRRWG